MMLTWQGLDAQRMEGVRIVLGERGMRATGAVVSAATDHAPAYSATYSLATGENGVVSRISVRAVTETDERQVTLNRTEDGIWLADHGQGAVRTDFDGALDVDLAACVLFNALPIRRLGLHRQPGEHDIPMVWVDLPDLTVHLTRQRYRSVSVGSAGEPSTVGFSQDDFAAEITVDAEGMVLDYPGLARRL